MTERNKERKRLRSGFSTGSAATAAARAALRLLLTGEAAEVVAVRLPAGYYLPIPVASVQREGDFATASVIKDGGDDPDATHRAEIRARVSVWSDPAGESKTGMRLCLTGGEGVGTVTRPGLPVGVGEPAINPVPREMLAANLAEEWALRGGVGPICPERAPLPAPHILLNLDPKEPFPKGHILMDVEISVPRGAEIARHTLNPRLGIVGGISILGTTGLVRPFSHEAYEETIRSALNVAASNGCSTAVLCTGGKSEKLAAAILPGLPDEAFVQIADFFAFSVNMAVRLGFRNIVHSAFFGKVVKMAQGHPYTHAHKVAMDLAPLADAAANAGYGDALSREIAQANTARHALELLTRAGASDVVRSVAVRAKFESERIAGPGVSVRLLMFDYDGSLLADILPEEGERHD